MTKKDKDLLKKIKDDFEEARIYKEDYFTKPAALAQKDEERHAFDILLAYKKWYDGDQWSVYPDATSMDTTQDVALPVINYVKTIIDQQAALIKKRRVSFDVRPVEKTDTDKAVAIDSVLKFIFKKRKIKHKISLAVKDSLIYGTGFLKVRWDGKNVDIETINPLNVYPDKYGYEIKDMRYIHILYEKTPEYIETNFEVKEQADENGRVLVYESWYNPIPLYLDGLYVLWTENNVLKTSNLKKMSPSKEIPIVDIRHDPDSNSFWGTSEVKTLAQVQLIHNKSLGFILDNLILTNNCQTKSTADIKKVNKPGYDYKIENSEDFTTTLVPVATPPLSPQWFSLLQYTGYNLFQALTGTYAVNFGGATTDTASGIIALQQAGGTMSDAMFEDIKIYSSKLADLILSFATLYSTDDLLKMMDKDLVIDKVDTNFDIIVEFGDALPDDKITRFNLLMQLLQGNKIDMAQFAEYLGDPQLMKYLDDFAKIAKLQQEQMMSNLQANINKNNQAQTPTETAVSNVREKVNQGLP